MMTMLRSRALELYVAVVALAGVALAGIVLGQQSVGGSIGWPLVALGFAASELGVIHVRFRRQAFSCTLHEAVLLLAVMQAAPRDVFIGLVLGTGSVMILRDRLGALKVAFNLGQYLLGGALVVAVLGGADTDVLSIPLGWVLALSANVLVGGCTMLLVGLALRLAQGVELSETLRATAAISLMMTVLSTGLGLGLGAIAETRPANLWLLVPLVAVLGVGVHSSHQLRVRAEQLEQIQGTLLTLTEAPDPRHVVSALASGAVVTTGAEEAVVVLHVDSGWWQFRRAADGAATWSTCSDADAQPLVAACAAAGGAARIGHDTHLLRELLPDGAGSQVLVAEITANGRSHGVIAVIQPPMTQTAGQRELDVLRSLAVQAALVIEARRLGSMWDGLHARSSVDALLGLPTAVALDDLVAECSDPMALVYVSIGGMETINDLYGFDVGDRVLESVAGRLTNLARPEDVLARVGGDEFALLISAATDPFAIEAFGERIAQQLGIPFRLDDEYDDISVTARVGVAFGVPGDADLHGLLRVAQEQLRRRRMRKHLGSSGW
jgi:diguanylate cyclase (GGDEF)-like protein